MADPGAPRPPRQPGRLAAEAGRSAAAVAIVVAAALLRRGLEGAFGPQPPFITFYPAVMVAALFLGLVPGLVATALSALFALYWAIAPAGTWVVSRGGDVAALSIFCTAGFFLSFMALLHQRARRRAAELEKDAALRVTLERLHLALRSGQAGAWEWDLRTGQNTWSDELWGVYGLAPHSCEPSFEAWRATVLPDDREAAERAVTEAARRGSDLEASWRVRGADGQVRWLLSKGQAERGPGGEVVRYAGIVLDVTERRRVEAALAENEALYRLLFELAPSGVVLIDEEGRIVTCNDAACRMHGYGRGELGGLSLADLSVDEPTPADVRSHLARIGSAGGDEFVVRHRTRDGEIRHLMVASRPVQVGGRGHYLAIWQDVTSRREAEEALRRSERRHRAIFEQAAVGVCEVESATGRVLEANQRMCRMTGYSREELLAMSWKDLTYPDEIAADEARVERMVATGEPYQREKRYVRKDGSVMWASLSVSPFALPGEVARTQVAVIVDVTERKRAEEAVLTSELRFRALIERSSDMIQVLDAQYRVQFWSQSSRDALGWTAEEMIGRSAIDFVHPEDRERMGALARQVLADPGVVARQAFRYQHRDGSWREVEGVARNMLADPAVRGVVINSRDVTEQRRLEEQVQQAQKLESVGRLAGGIAHDFNNLLTVILSAAEALHDRLDGRDPRSREEVQELQTAAERARDLTRQLLAFARKQLVAPVALDLNTVIRANQRMLGRLLGEDVELRTLLQPGLWLVQADPSQLEQVILNLAVNARDAMPIGGRLELETRNQAVQAAEASQGVDLHPGEWVELVVRDTGTGMTPEVRAHLFEPFFTTKEPGKGTGLGLATVYGIVSQAGGHVHVASAPGEGTAIQICLPRGAEDQEPLQPRAAPAPGRGTERVLVVEDDPQVRTTLVRMLAGAGYQVTAVGHPHQALELGAEDLLRTQLLVTDVVMPGSDGHTLAVELERRRPGLRVLYVSGYTRDAISARGVVDEGAAFLSKPFTRAALLEKVRTLLDGAHPG